MSSRKSPRTLERQLNQLVTMAEERRALMKRRNANKTARRSFERHNANVPLKRSRSRGRTRSRSRSQGRVYENPVEVIEVPAMSRRRSSSGELEPSGVYVSKWNFYNDKPRVLRGESQYENTLENRQHAQEEISRLINRYHLQKKHK
jgi:hypothetical protein